MIQDQADYDMALWLFGKQANEALSEGVAPEKLRALLEQSIQESKKYEYEVYSPEEGT